MKIYADRRKRLAESIEDNSVVVLYSNDNPSTDWKFNVNRNFYYLTGIDAKSEVLVISKINGEVKETIFILPYDEVQAKWVGGRLRDYEVRKLSSIEDVKYEEDFDSYIESLVSKTNIKFLLDLSDNEYNLTTYSENFANEVSDAYENVEIDDVFRYMANLRLIKDSYEISCFKIAIDITKQGVEAMMKAIKPQMGEMEMEGIFDLELKKNMCSETSFKTIAASGERATILHYSENNHIMQDGELFLQDLGATFNHYCADVTRTYPVNGKFSKRQKEIYNTILACQKMVEKNAKPGASIKGLQQMVIDFYKEELPKIGLNEDVREYYYHGISHQIGLDCHDLNGGLGDILKPGMIISNEPGLYIAKEKIGIRIEDDLLISEDGCINLTKDIIKEVDEIEEFMKH